MRERQTSPLAEALARVGDRWTLLVVQALLGGSRRFNELLEQIPGIAPNVLSERLKRLERDALVISRPYTDRPPRAAYELTAEGRNSPVHCACWRIGERGTLSPPRRLGTCLRNPARGQVVLPDL